MKILDYQKQAFLALAHQRNWLSDRQRELIEAVCVPVSACLDRSGSLDTGVPYEIMDPVPAHDPSFNKSLRDVQLEEASELLTITRALGKRLCLLWSGGIDSTAALTALLRVGALRSELLIIMSDASLAEYPLFYERYVKDNLDVRMICPAVYPDLDESDFMVTGELGDQIFGSLLIDFYERHRILRYAQVFDEPWENHLKYRHHGSKTLRESFEPLVLACPFKIKCIYDFLWWMNFTCKWQHVIFRLSNHSKNSLRMMSNVHHFYRTEAHQQLSMNEDFHRTQKADREYLSYKVGLKRFIEEFTHDQEYTRYKQKIGSLPVKFHVQQFLFLLDSGERVSFGRLCNNPQLFEERHGDRFDHLFQGSMACA